MKGCILIVITLFLIGCTKDDPTPDDSTVHLAGFVTTNHGGSPVASYWRDGVYTDLTNDSINSNVSSLDVDGSRVFIGGNIRPQVTPSRAVIWQDGVENVLDEAFGDPMIASRNNNLFGVWHDIGGEGWMFHKDGTTQPIIDTALSFGPMAMTVAEDDVYISGYSSSVPPSPPTYVAPQYAQYWKNGQLIFRESVVSNALSIFVHQNNIYMAGLLYLPGNLTSIACYWKNGQRVDLTDGTGVAMARSVFVTGTNVYVAGMIDNQVVYWKDGVVIPLTTPGTYSMANTIFVHGTDVHVGGYENGYPAYWKNDVKQDIENQDKRGQIKFIVVGSN
jgi:hypothetical protein